MTSGNGRNGLNQQAIAGVLALAIGVVGFAVSALAGTETVPQKIVVTLDKAKLVKLPEKVDTIVIGSPIVADVTMLKKSGLVVVTGKGFGETNVIFLDGSGQAVSEATIQVARPENLLTVQRGIDRESYACAPRCEPTVALGDSTKYISEASGQILSRNSLAAPH